MMGDYHVRFCERLGVKLPLSTRHKLVVQHLNFVLNASITKKFFDKLETSLSFNDIFDNLQYRERYLLQNIKVKNIFYSDRNKISISLKYSFGEIKNIAYKNKDIDENLNRIK
ncbi:MAG: hypothetical protein CVU01_03030 [Bacteroidetes bacterium HGW-Bacteroidetes-18]|nr:MAG: hypothetical protein CVU01_03030 [Bacteroidetes bacterium HGW-Bacteroidetes-18]